MTFSFLTAILPLLHFAVVMTSCAADGGSSFQLFRDVRSCNQTMLADVEPPPLRHWKKNDNNNNGEENQQQLQERRDRRLFVDHILGQFWQEGGFSNEMGREYTYGEVTPLGVRQLAYEMGLYETTRKENDDYDDDDDHHLHGNDVVFYDLGSGVGRLAVQLSLEHDLQHAMKKVVGVELSDRRHAIAMKSWNAVQTYMMIDQEAEVSAVTNDDDDGNTGTAPVMVEFRNNNILNTDFSDATHLYLSSLCFPPHVTEAVTKIIVQNSKQYGKLKVVAALSDLTLLEEDATTEEEKRWEKTTRDIQMTWGGGKVRIYAYR